jgi:uncharacterized coiled-coil protein SlyX
MEYIIQTQDYKDLYRLVARPFELEYQKRFQEAIAAHDAALQFLNSLMERIRGKIRKLHRKMLERQIAIHHKKEIFSSKA